MIHHDYSKVQEAIHDESTWACIDYQPSDGCRWAVPRCDERVRHPAKEAIRDALKIQPGADPVLVRAYFNFRPEGA